MPPMLLLLACLSCVRAPCLLDDDDQAGIMMVQSAMAFEKKSFNFHRSAAGLTVTDVTPPVLTNHHRQQPACRSLTDHGCCLPACLLQEGETSTLPQTDTDLGPALPVGLAKTGELPPGGVAAPPHGGADHHHHASSAAPTAAGGGDPAHPPQA